MSIKNLSLRRPDHRFSTRREKWSKLGEADLDAVAAAYARGDRISDIAEKFGISHSTPADIARRKGIPLRYNVPCLCWAYGNITQDCSDAIDEARFRAPDETLGLRFGFLRRVHMRDKFNATRRASY